MKTVLVTGATGTFGHAIVPVLLERGVRAIVFSRDEAKQSEMRRRIPHRRLEFFIGDVRDPEALREACACGIDLLIHAAALKQVQTGENFPSEVHKTNVGGAINVIAAARGAGIPRVVALSTDKAVAPVNVYGKSKAQAEGLFIAANVAATRAKQRTQLVAVRYGNVIGSRGSVVPLFLQQAASGTMYVTDRRASRFWMPIDAAVDTVLWAAEHAPAGSIVVPKIPSATVVDMARAIGGGDCAIEETGLGPGEKLHEALIAPDEARRTWECGGYYVILADDGSLETAYARGHRHGIGPLKEALSGQRVPADFQYTSDQDPLPVTFTREALCASQ